MKEKNAFVRLTRTLSGVPSLFWAFSFILLVPLFAAVYWLLPYEFYHATARFEQIVNRDSDRLLAALHEAIAQPFRDAHGNEAVARGSWMFAVDDLTLKAIQVKENSITVESDLLFRQRDHGESDSADYRSGSEQVLPFSFSFGTAVKLAFFEPAAATRTVIKKIQVDDQEPLPLPLTALFPYRVATAQRPESWSDEDPLLPIPQPLHDDLVEFSNAVRGFPSRITGSYARMLYFSAVTITTLGYGDIVPLTDFARLLVAFESVLGLLLIGLFLNSLFREEQR